MTLPLPVHVAASGFELLVWLIVGLIWLVFQGLAAAKKKSSQGEGEEQPPLRPPPHKEEVPGDELRELIETLTGRKPPMQAEDDEEAEPPALPRPAPRPVIVRKMTLPPQRRTAVAAARPAPPPIPPPVPELVATPEPAPVLTAQMVFAQAEMTREALRLAPLMKMKWPRSQLQRLGGAAKRTADAARLKRQLLGHAALRQAMVSRIVLGPPGGR